MLAHEPPRGRPLSADRSGRRYESGVGLGSIGVQLKSALPLSTTSESRLRLQLARGPSRRKQHGGVGAACEKFFFEGETLTNT